MTADPAALEAILFTAGRPVGVRELERALGATEGDVEAALEALAQRYRSGGLEVVAVGEGWTMQVRGAYRAAAAPWGPPDLPREVLRTAALIAYHQPIRQSRLVALVGSRAYRDVTTLARMHLITARTAGHTLELSTTPRFVEYFGLGVGDREELKALLGQRIAGADKPGG